MAPTNPIYTPKQPTIQHDIKQHNETMLSKNSTNGTVEPQSMLTNIPEIIRHILSSDTHLRNKTHPAPGNQLWVLYNMATTQRKTYFKVSPKVINHGQREPLQTEVRASGRSCLKWKKYSNKGKRNTNEILFHIFDPTENIYSYINGKLTVQPDRGNNYILLAYNSDANNILTTALKNRTGTYTMNGITRISWQIWESGD